MSEPNVGTDLSGRLAALNSKYKVKEINPAEYRARAIDRSAVSRLEKTAGRAPSAKTGPTLGDQYAEIAQIEMDLMKYANERGQLEMNLTNLIGKDKIYTFGDAFTVAMYTILMQKEKAQNVKIQAIRRHGNSIEILEGKVANVFKEGHQKILEATGKIRTYHLETIQHQKQLERKIIECLETSYDRVPDLADAEKALAGLKADIAETDVLMTDYQKRLDEAKSKGDIDQMRALSKEARQVLDIREGILDGVYAGEETERQIRHQILDKAEGLQSARGALSHARVNYKALSIQLDAYQKLEIKYRHAMEDMLPVFKQQARIAMFGRNIEDLSTSLTEAADISQRLAAANEGLVKRIGTEVQQLLQTSLYDPAKAKEIEERLDTFFEELIANDKEWAGVQQQVYDVRDQAYQAMHQ